MTGKPTVHGLARLAELGRVYQKPTKKSPNTTDDEEAATEPGENIILIVHGSRTIFNQDVYHEVKHDYPMKMTNVIGHIGKTSLSSVSTLCEKSTNKELVWNLLNLVVIDPFQGKPVPIPEKFKAGLSAPSMKSGVRLERHNKPAISHHYTLKAAASDCDHLNHVSHVNYMRFLVDAANDADNSQALIKFPGIFQEYDINQIDMIHIRECVAGDELVISVWEDENDDLKLHFLLEKENNSHLFSTFIYYSYETSSKL